MRNRCDSTIFSAVLCAAALIVFSGLLFAAVHFQLDWLIFLAAPVLAAAVFWEMHAFSGAGSGKNSTASLPSEAPDAASDIQTAPNSRPLDEETAIQKLFMNHRLSALEYDYVYNTSGLKNYNVYVTVLLAPYPDPDDPVSFSELPSAEKKRHMDIMYSFAGRLCPLMELECSSWETVTAQGLGVLVAWISDSPESMKAEAERIRLAALELTNRFFAGSGRQYAVAIGTPEKEIPYIYYAYTRACGMLDRIFYRQDKIGVVYSEDIDTYKDTICARIVQLDRRFYATALALDPISALEIMLQTVDIEYEELSYSVSVMADFCKEKFNALMRIIGFGENNSFGMSPDFWRSSIKRLHYAVSANDLRAAIEAISEDMKQHYTSSPKSDAQYTPDVSQYTSYIRKNYLLPNLNAQMVCEHFGLTPSAMSKQFKKETGYGVLEFIHLCRLEKAKELLSGDMDIDCIALQCGFYTRRAFDSVFKRYTGVSASTYRSSVLKNIEE